MLVNEVIVEKQLLAIYVPLNSFRIRLSDRLYKI
jgi:hypothetical protein